jgi:hypothetical protein
LSSLSLALPPEDPKKRLPELFYSLAVCLIVFCHLLRPEDHLPYLIGLAIEFPTAGGAMLKP